MNWARGFFRLWLVLSILWIAIFSITFRPDQALSLYNGSYAEAVDIATRLREGTSNDNFTEAQFEAIQRARLRRTDLKVQRHKSDLLNFLAIGPGVSAMFWLIGAGLFWAMRGFTHRKSD
jgi:hypothetical protein